MVAYNPLWPVFFNTEQSNLKDKLEGTATAVHHIGSTAVPGLAAKPIIDILVEVTSLEALDALNDKMVSIGYVPLGENGISGRRYFQKGGNERTHHIHAFAVGDPNITRHLMFRDYLRANQDIADEYADLKLRVAADCKNDSHKYCEDKDCFVKKHERLSLKGKTMDLISSALKRFPKLNFSILPTPIHRLERLSDMLGADLYCKRDDLTGFAMGGNKNRKLDFLIAEALEQGKDTVIGVGANQSNFCRMAAGCSAAAGLDVHLVLGGKKPEKDTGNLLLDKLFGAVIHHVDTKDWDAWEEQGKELKKDLEAQGKKVYYLPVGGSTPTGALGYVSAMDEIVKQSISMGVEFQTVIHASSSAGTQSGLVIGKAMSGWTGDITGIGVAKNKLQLEQDIKELSGQTANLLDTEYNPADIFVDDSYAGEEYGARTEKGTEAIELFAQKEGIILDHVYSGKAAAAMIDYARKGRFGKNDNVLFIHTGGNIEIFE